MKKYFLRSTFTCMENSVIDWTELHYIYKRKKFFLTRADVSELHKKKLYGYKEVTEFLINKFFEQRKKDRVNICIKARKRREKNKLKKSRKRFGSSKEVATFAKSLITNLK